MKTVLEKRKRRLIEPLRKTQPKPQQKLQLNEHMLLEYQIEFIISRRAEEEETEAAKQLLTEGEDLLIVLLLMLVDQYILIQEKNVE